MKSCMRIFPKIEHCVSGMLKDERFRLLVLFSSPETLQREEIGSLTSKQKHDPLTCKFHRAVNHSVPRDRSCSIHDRVFWIDPWGGAIWLMYMAKDGSVSHTSRLIERVSLQPLTGANRNRGRWWTPATNVLKLTSLSWAERVSIAIIKIGIRCWLLISYLSLVTRLSYLLNDRKKSLPANIDEHHNFFFSLLFRARVTPREPGNEEVLFKSCR